MGADEIASVLTMNKTLTVLNLRHNNIGIAGGEALCDMMEFNYNIRQLCVARQAAFTRHVVLEIFVKKRLARRAARGY